ncbi:MAG: EI24 domain-containing protein [Alphaproteobacteria bacterium]|jgi:CysZ protein|tara:strand:+ start:192 stop:896 length:705 start_codon:yes stop_codon:yes gene_type:complete
MISSFFKAIGQIPDPDFRSVMGRSLLYAIGIFVLLLSFTWWLIVSSRFFGIGWLEWIVDFVGGATAVVVAFLLFPGAMMFVVSLMLEKIARAVEKKHYPYLPPPQPQAMSETVLIGLRYTSIVIALNLLFLPLFFIPVINIFVFIGLNGYLLGREYFELVALRRLEPDAVRKIWREHRSQLCIAGMIITSLLTIPVVNWFMPVVAAAYMLHIFERIPYKDAVISSTNSSPAAIE